MKEINYHIDIDFADEFANKHKIDASKFSDNMIFSMKLGRTFLSIGWQIP